MVAVIDPVKRTVCRRWFGDSLMAMATSDARVATERQIRTTAKV